VIDILNAAIDGATTTDLNRLADRMTRNDRAKLRDVLKRVDDAVDDRDRCPSCNTRIRPGTPGTITINNAQRWHTVHYYGPNGAPK
jgi:hypothetical protein